MTSWAEAKKRSDDYDDGGDYLKLKDGQSILCTFVGTPKPREVVWDNIAGRSRDADTPEGKDLVAEGERVKLRWVLGVAIDGDIKTWETSNMTFNDEVLEAFDDAPREKTVWKLKRKGLGKDTKYSVRRARDMTSAELEIFAIQDRDSGGRPATNGGSDKLDAVATDAIKQALEGVDIAEQAAFLNYFEAKRFSDIPADQAEQALHLARQTKEREKWLEPKA